MCFVYCITTSISITNPTQALCLPHHLTIHLPVLPLLSPCPFCFCNIIVVTIFLFHVIVIIIIIIIIISEMFQKIALCIGYFKLLYVSTISCVNVILLFLSVSLVLFCFCNRSQRRGRTENCKSRVALKTLICVAVLVLFAKISWVY